MLSDIYAKLNNVTTDELRRINRSYTQAISEGDISGHYPLRLSASLAAVGTSWTDFWGGAPTIAECPVLDTAISMEIVSTSIEDVSIGTGIYKVRLSYLDSLGALKSAVLSLTGTVPVALPEDVLHINKLYIVEAGSGATAPYATAGTITIQATGGGTVYASLPAGTTSEVRMVVRVPAGNTIYISSIVGFGIALANNSDMQVRLVANIDEYDGSTLPLGTWITLWQSGAASGGGQLDVNFAMPYKLPAGTVIKLQARRLSGSGLANASAGIYGWRE